MCCPVVRRVLVHRKTGGGRHSTSALARRPSLDSLPLVKDLGVLMGNVAVPPLAVAAPWRMKSKHSPCLRGFSKKSFNGPMLAVENITKLNVHARVALSPSRFAGRTGTKSSHCRRPKVARIKLSFSSYLLYDVSW